MDSLRSRSSNDKHKNTKQIHPHRSNRNRTEIGPASTPLIDDDHEHHHHHHNQIQNKQRSSSNLVDLETIWFKNKTRRVQDCRTSEDEYEETEDDKIDRAKQQQSSNIKPSSSTLFYGLTLFVCSSSLWIIGLPLIVFSDSNQRHQQKINQNSMVRFLLEDEHYKYLLPLQITLGLVFVIINWGGLKIFRHS